MNILPSFRLWAAALITVLLPFVVLAGKADARIIANTAEATWSLSGSEGRTTSNTVSIAVQTPPLAIRTFTPSAGSGRSVSFLAPRCAASPAAAQGTALSSGDSALVRTVTETRSVNAGREVLFEVAAAVANADSAAIDRLLAVITTSTGDREEITVFETAADSGIFVGTIPTRRMPPMPAAGDCILSLADGSTIEIAARLPGNPAVMARADVEVLADPFGMVFDSETGEPVSGARVTLVDAATGQPARVFAEDGVTQWPSSLISGEPITDAAGNVYPMAPGEYWFPLTFLGSYRLLVEPRAPYSAPSKVARASLAELSRPDGSPFIIADASFGGTLTLIDSTPVEIDIPVDRPSLDVSLTKDASRQNAQPGDAVFYTIVARNADPARIKRNVVVADTPSRWLRLRPESIRINGAAAPDAITIAPDGSRLTIALGDLSAGATRRITYAMVVRADAPPGRAVNRAEATDSLGRTVRAQAALDIERDTIAGRMTIIGRITGGSCSLHENRPGIPGVRVMLEDGSFAVTDADGRYHFEGVTPGTHVVQAARMTLPEGGEFVDCSRSTRNAGSASSRFVIGQGGSLAVADFHADLPQVALTALGARPGEAAAPAKGKDEAFAAGQPATDADPIDWIALGDGPDGWLTPTENHNPRAPAVKVAIRHRKGQSVKLYVDGKPVDPLAFDGMKSAQNGRFAVSLWRGVPLADERTVLKAEILNSLGGVNKEIERVVHFVSAPARMELVREQSVLIADGVTRPVVAVRVVDRNGRALRQGISGDFTLNQPFESAAQLELQQLRQLTGLGSSSARWVIDGEDGIARIELAPTMVSGSLRLEFRFSDGTIERRQMLETWIEPGDVEWTIVGLAEGSAGARTVAENMERTADFSSDMGDNARVALYTKGRILGKYLVTLAYDSAKQRGDQRVLGALDPDAYYTVFADGSSRRFDAPSRDKLYLRIETATFFALYGDFQTGFDQTQLARYSRTATGVKAEARLGAIKAQGFAAKVGSQFRRDEIQGNGLSGPYRIGSRDIISNSEQVSIEVRDRFRSEIIVSRRTLTRFIDYDLDLLSGTISFSEPVASRDFDFNPQFIVIDYEVGSLGGAEWNAGTRADWTSKSGALRIGATAITDQGEGERTTIGAVDLRARIAETSELRAELALSRRAGETANGWLVEVEHQTGKLDLLAYARSLEQEYGVGQQNGAELGRRKIGLDARYDLNEQLGALVSLWQDDSLADASRRRAAQGQLAWHTKETELRLGLTHFDDRLPDATRNTSTLLEAGASRRLLGNRLELGISTSLALDDPESIDLPARHRFDARFALTQAVKLIGSYEIAEGDTIKARTMKGGVEVSPWSGARATTALGKQDIGELGNRSFAAFGLAQTIRVSSTLSLDATAESTRTLGGKPLAGDIINGSQPVASGGQLGTDGTVFEDFTAITLGGAWRHDRWSVTGRAEYRDGELADRKGFTFGAIRQLGEGRVAGSGVVWTRAKGVNGTITEVIDGSIAMAHRPANSAFAFLGKLEYRSDKVVNAVAGETGPAGRTALLVDGDARSRRLIASLSANLSPGGKDAQGLMTRRDEFGLFLAARHNFDRFEGFDLEGLTVLAGLDARMGIGERFEIGAAVTVRSNLKDGVTSFSVGPQIGFSPVKDVLVTVGYNIAGFRDRDFSAARSTDKGAFASVRAKFDADTFSFLGLGR